MPTHDTSEPTHRQWQVASLIVLGHTNKEIGDKLGITEKTVINTRQDLYHRLGCHNAAELCRIMYAEGRIEGQAFVGTKRMQLTSRIQYLEEQLQSARDELSKLVTP
jgi:DNA-binding CsgD family transcriptional regulator